MENTIRSLPGADEAVAAMLGRAFAGNPAFGWAIPKRSKDGGDFQWFMDKMVRIALPMGRARVSGAARGAALWMPPGKTLSIAAAIRGGMAALPFKLGFTSLSRQLRFMGLNERWHRRIMGATPCWYLFLLGVDPAFQGRGIGSELLADTTAVADAGGHPCYLETDRESSVRLYEKHGFTVEARDHLAPGVPMWYMKRESR